MEKPKKNPLVYVLSASAAFAIFVNNLIVSSQYIKPQLEGIICLIALTVIESAVLYFIFSKKAAFNFLLSSFLLLIAVPALGVFIGLDVLWFLVLGYCVSIIINSLSLMWVLTSEKIHYIPPFFKKVSLLKSLFLLVVLVALNSPLFFFIRSFYQFRVFEVSPVLIGAFCVHSIVTLYIYGSIVKNLEERA
jgi:hypothetical protein